MKAADVVPPDSIHAVANARGASGVGPSPVCVRFGRFELDEANALLLCDGKGVALAPRPFNLLCVLARQPGFLLTKDSLLDEVWGHQFVSDAVLKTAISDLRMALGDDPRDPRYIQTVSRRGYRFIAATAVVPAARSVRANVAAAPAQRDRGIDTSAGGIGCSPSQPAFPTMEEMLRAQQLWLQLKALFVGPLSQEAEPVATH